jgi:lipopolysaccharide exporter
MAARQRPHTSHHSPLHGQAARAVPWSMLGFGATKAVMFLSTIVLARILVPRDFGLIAIAGLVTGAISLLASGGLANALVLRQDLDRRGLAAAHGLMIALGLAGAAIGVLAAPLAARAFDVPGSQGVLAAIAALLAFFGIWSFYEALLRRELRLKTLFACNLLQAVLYAAVAIPLAATGSGVWSLVGGQVAGSVAYTMAIVGLSPLRVRPRWDTVAAREIWQTGKGFLAHSALWWASTNIDYVLVARFIGPAGLGAYSMAYRLIEVPNQSVADPVAEVSFPSFARLRHQGLDVFRPYLRVLSLVALVACPLATVLSATADPFVGAVLGSHWEHAVGPLAILGLWGAILPLSTTGAWLLKSIGRPMETAKIHGTTLVVFLGPLIVAAVLGGLTAVAAVMLARGVATYALVLRGGRRIAALPFAEHLRPLRGVGPGCAAAWVSAHGIAVLLGGEAAAVALVASAVVGIAAYLLVVRMLDPSLLPLARSQARLALSRGLAGQQAGSATA